MSGPVEGGGPGQPAGQIRRRWLPNTEVIGPPECPILHRWTLVPWGEYTDGLGRVGSGRPKKNWKLLLHHFLPNADDRDVHDHPRPFVTLVLRGYYDDMRACDACGGTGERLVRHVIDYPTTMSFTTVAACAACKASGVVLRERMKAGMLRYRPAIHAHRTKVGPRGCWTIVIMGPLQRRWGFWRGAEWFYWKDYEHKFGFGMRCDNDG